MAWSWQITHGKSTPLPGVKPYESEDALIKDVKEAVESGKAKSGRLPRVLVIGALGRCGRGAVDLCTRAGLEEILVSCSHSTSHLTLQLRANKRLHRNGTSPKHPPSLVLTKK